MKASDVFRVISIQVITAFVAGAAFAGESTSVTQFQSDSGTVTFESATNMPGIEVKGKSNALSAKVEIAKEPDKLTLHRMDATVAVTTLATGMKVRDEHMRKYIFRTSDGQEPDLHFIGTESVCEKAAGHDFICQINGTLSIRGVEKPLNFALKAREEGSGEGFRATGDALVRLSTYGIPAPSQFGVKPNDEVKLHLDFTAKARPVTSAGVIR